MITPKEYLQIHHATQLRNQEQQERIEDFIDERIKANQLTFPAPRSGWLIENINKARTTTGLTLVRSFRGDYKLVAEQEEKR